MRAIVELLPVVLVLLAVWFLGVRTGRMQAGLRRDERRELEEHRRQERWLLTKASEHAVLGDDFAVIVLAELNKEKEIG